MKKATATGGISYAEAGVDIEAGDEAVRRIKALARKTFTKGVLSEIGYFGGFFRPDLRDLRKPVLIASADGVGTKLKIAFMTDRHDTVGEDLVNHCVNDILVHGARPLFFLDYIATGKVRPQTIAHIVSGFSRGCRNAGMALLGGETAEMPDFYAADEYDLAGFIVGIVDQSRIIDGRAIKAGDVCIGLPSNGLHTNGYTLARAIAFDIAGLAPDSPLPGARTTVGAALMKVHRCYAPMVFPLLDRFEVRGMAHITGGGIEGNLSRIIPSGLSAVVDKAAWPVLPVFKFLQGAGNVAEPEMYKTFNMGIGYILVVKEKDAEAVMKFMNAARRKSYRIGEIIKGKAKVVLK